MKDKTNTRKTINIFVFVCFFCVIVHLSYCITIYIWYLIPFFYTSFSTFIVQYSKYVLFLMSQKWKYKNGLYVPLTKYEILIMKKPNSIGQYILLSRLFFESGEKQYKQQPNISHLNSEQYKTNISIF